MNIASLLPRRALAALALTLAAAAPARAAAADPPATPPQDLPPLPGAAPVAPGTPAQPAPGAPAPRTPGPPVPVPWTPLPTPPAGAAPAKPAAPAPYWPYSYPPPYSYPGWGTSPSEVPPGYQVPGVPATNPYAYPGGVPPRQDDAYGLPPPLPRRHYNTGLFAGGVIAVGAGVAAVLIGSYLVASAADRINIYCDSSQPCAYKDDGPRLAAGAVTMAGGTLLAIVGIPMWFIGARYVTIPKGEQPQKAALVPELHVGPGGGSISFRF